MRICNVVEYDKALEKLEMLRAEWDNYYINYERGRMNYYEYSLITNELEIKMDILERAMDEWKGEPIRKKQRITKAK